MPYQSKAQQGYLHSQKPDVAAHFDAATPKSSYAKLPRKVHHRGRPGSRYGGTSVTGRRTPDPDTAGKASDSGHGRKQVRKAFTPTTVLARTKPIAQLAADGGANLSPAGNAAQAVNAPKMQGSAGAAGKTNTLAGKLTGMAASKPMTGMNGAGGKLASMGAQQSQKPVAAMGSIGTIGSMSKAENPGWVENTIQELRRAGLSTAEAREHAGANNFAAHSDIKAMRYRERFRANGEPRPGLKTSPIRRRRHLTAEDQDYLGPESDYQHTSGNRVRKADRPMLVRTQRRSHDPERGRQFRLGAATAGTAAGGGLMLARGGRELRELNRAHPTGMARTALVNVKGGSKAGVGIAGLVGASQLARYAAGNKNRRWT